MMKIILSIFLLFAISCSKNEASKSSGFYPLDEKKEDPLKLGGTGACTVDQKKDCDKK